VSVSQILGVPPTAGRSPPRPQRGHRLLNVGAFDLLREGLEGLAFFRLLLGSEPGEGRGLGLPRRCERRCWVLL